MGQKNQKKSRIELEEHAGIGSWPILTVYVNRASLLNGSLHRHPATQVPWTQWGFHRQLALKIYRAYQMLIQISLNVRVKLWIVSEWRLTFRKKKENSNSH